MGALLDGLTDSDFNPFDVPIPEINPLDVAPPAEKDTPEYEPDDDCPF
jgi:hypothetical protein